MESLEYAFSFVQAGANNFYRNFFGMWDGMNVIRFIRMVAIVGAYFLLRPYLMKIGEYLQGKQHEKEIDTDELAGPKAKISPNQLRGAGGKEVEIPDSDEEEEAEGTGADWGKKARKRQRQLVKKVLEEDEKRRRELQEDDEDKDIQEYLVDYVEGEDGW